MTDAIYPFSLKGCNVKAQGSALGIVAPKISSPLGALQESHSLHQPTAKLPNERNDDPCAFAPIASLR